MLGKGADGVEAGAARAGGGILSNHANMKKLLLALGILLPAIATAAPRNIIIDTDAGSDDMIAIAAYLGSVEP